MGGSCSTQRNEASKSAVYAKDDAKDDDEEDDVVPDLGNKENDVVPDIKKPVMSAKKSIVAASDFSKFQQNTGGHADDEDTADAVLPEKPPGASPFPVIESSDVVVVPPGRCQLGPGEFLALPLVARQVVNHDTRIFTFACPDTTKPLGLSTIASVLVRAMIEGEDDQVIRPYTPISTNNLVGTFELLVKIYKTGRMSSHMDNMALGETLEFKHLPVELKKRPSSIGIKPVPGSGSSGGSRTLYPFRNVNHVVMIVGGTGITPMIQALHAIIGTKNDNTQVTMLYGSRTQHDILGKELLDAWAVKYAAQFKVFHVLSREPAGSDWKGARGRIDGKILDEYCPKVAEDIRVFVCGPDAMFGSICGARNKLEVDGEIARLGFQKEQVVKL